MSNPVDLTTNIGGITLQNPVLTASGTFGYGAEYQPFMDINRLGGVVIKGLSLKPAKGNPPPRIVETPCGMLNAIGLENVGLDDFIREKLPFLSRLNTRVFVNIWGTKIEDYARLSEAMDNLPDIAGVEVNISCPNIKAGGIAFGMDPKTAAAVTERVRENTDKPVMVKLSPNVTDITEIARAVESAGADCVSLINTITGMAVDIDKRRPVLANITGGLSGPAIKPVALRMVWQAVNAVRIPVVGVGGIMTANDALEFLMVGASAVQVGTANFVDPSASLGIIDGIEQFMLEKGMKSVSDLVGTLIV